MRVFPPRRLDNHWTRSGKRPGGGRALRWCATTSAFQHSCELVEDLARLVLALGQPVGQRLVEAGPERLDELADGVPAVVAQLDELDPTVGGIRAPLQQPTP